MYTTLDLPQGTNPGRWAPRGEGNYIAFSDFLLRSLYKRSSYPTRLQQKYSSHTFDQCVPHPTRLKQKYSSHTFIECVPHPTSLGNVARGATRQKKTSTGTTGSERRPPRVAPGPTPAQHYRTTSGCPQPWHSCRGHTHYPHRPTLGQGIWDPGGSSPSKHVDGGSMGLCEVRCEKHSELSNQAWLEFDRSAGTRN
jgi:hypothetical protein